MTEPQDITDRLSLYARRIEARGLNAPLERLVHRLLTDANLEIVNLRLRLRHAYDRENQAREITVPPPASLPRRWRGWRWRP